MGQETAIEWTDATWNPIRGCTRISAGCKNCYAERVAARFSKLGQWAHGFAEMTNLGPKWTGKLEVVMDHLKDPIRWKEPRRIFVNSMSDLFHEDLSFTDIALVFKAMKLAKHHTFQILTKRAEIMHDFVNLWGEDLPNVWLGVSVENQKAVDERVPFLLETKAAAVRFLSCEPLIEKIDLTKSQTINQLAGPIDWVIVGGESGPDARECDVRWIRNVVDTCRNISVPVFVKQLGARVLDANDAGFDGHDAECWPEGTETDDWHEDPSRQYQGAETRVMLSSRKGGDMAEWPEDLRVREFPAVKSGAR